MIDFTPQQLVLRLCALAFIAAVHGMTVAAAAVAMGDAGPRHDRRLRLNPLVHMDILGSISGVLFSCGWIRPIAIDPAQLRPGRLGLALAVVAGAAATMLGALALRLARPSILPLLPDTASSVVFALIEITGQLSLWFALINLLPIPPLTGAHLLTAALPRQRDLVQRLHIPGAIVLTILAATGLLTGALAPLYRSLAERILAE